MIPGMIACDSEPGTWEKLMPEEPNRALSPERKVLYYAGLGCSGLGMLLFFSVFVTGCMNFGNFENFEGNARSSMARGLGGMALMLIGGFLMNLGRHGAAGSGLLLDPQKSRKDLEPWSRAAGGMTNDALEEIDLAQKLEDKLDEPEVPPPLPIVKVRCRACQSLNDEHAKFCNQCGAAI
jgi:hypothetical protein